MQNRSSAVHRISTQFKTITIIILFYCLSSSLVQAEVVTRANTIIKTDHYLLSNNLYNDGSDMSYDPAQIDALGAAFSIDYVDAGGSGMDAYVQGTIGGTKAGGSWLPGDYSLTGMPVQIQSLDDSFRLKWATFQNSDAHDADDKWWATINVIFDGGSGVAEPVGADRDYDVVIQMERYEQDPLTDKEKANNASYWWFARNPDLTIKPLVLNVDGVGYKWAVRYKFFQNSGDKNTKVHIKFIPVDNNNVTPYIDHPLKTFVDATVDYLQYIDIPSAELALANEKVADPNLWVKSVRAGYEVYTGQFTVGNEYFKTIIDSVAPDTPANLSAVESSDHIAVKWDPINDNAFQAYALYRSANGGAFALMNSELYNNVYKDNDVSIGNSYDYYVIAQDRSFNESPASPVVTVTLESGDDGSNDGDDSGGSGAVYYGLALLGLVIWRRKLKNTHKSVVRKNSTSRCNNSLSATIG